MIVGAWPSVSSASESKAPSSAKHQRAADAPARSSRHRTGMPATTSSVIMTGPSAERPAVRAVSADAADQLPEGKVIEDRIDRARSAGRFPTNADEPVIPDDDRGGRRAGLPDVEPPASRGIPDEGDDAARIAVAQCRRDPAPLLDHRAQTLMDRLGQPWTLPLGPIRDRRGRSVPRRDGGPQLRDRRGRRNGGRCPRRRFRPTGRRRSARGQRDRRDKERGWHGARSAPRFHRRASVARTDPPWAAFAPHLERAHLQ